MPEQGKAAYFARKRGIPKSHHISAAQRTTGKRDSSANVAEAGLLI
jgi:hypothetical protein